MHAVIHPRMRAGSDRFSRTSAITLRGSLRLICSVARGLVLEGGGQRRRKSAEQRAFDMAPSPAPHGCAIVNSSSRDTSVTVAAPMQDSIDETAIVVRRKPDRRRVPRTGSIYDSVLSSGSTHRLRLPGKLSPWAFHATTLHGSASAGRSTPVYLRRLLVSLDVVTADEATVLNTVLGELDPGDRSPDKASERCHQQLPSGGAQ